MAIPYGMLPMEALVAMSGAEAANAPGYLDAARMWTDVRGWIDDARTELRTRSESLLPHWQDEAARDWAARVRADDADLAGWAARIDGSQVAQTLTTLSGAISRTHAEVLALHGQYLAALSNPLTAWAAVGFQQAAGAVMSALGAQFDVAIAKTAAAAGVKPPDVPTVDVKPSAEGNTPEDALKALTATADAMSELETFASGLGMGTGADRSGTYAGGLPALAGVDTPTLPTGGTLTSPTLGAGAGPTLSGATLPYGTLGSTGLPVTAKPLPAKRAPVAAADVAPTARVPTPVATSGTAAVPPAMPPMTGQAAGATVRPASGTTPTGRSRTTSRRTDGTAAAPADLRGRTA
jgi:hypothetical protein